MTRISDLKGWVRAHPIAAFCVWFFPVAWGIALLPLVVVSEVPLEVYLSAATLLGGLLPVVVITWMVDGAAGLDAFRRQLLPSGAAIGWYVLAILPVPLISLALAMVFNGAPNVTLAELMSAMLNGLLVQGVLGLLAVNLWEEATWMGFVQARLQARRGVWSAAVLTAVLFALQHLPLFVQGGLTNVAGLIVLVVFIVVAIPFRALTAWMYNRTGSLFLVGLLHAIADATTNGSFASGFLPRLYPNGDVGMLHILALALIGLVVVAATRGRLGVASRSTPIAQPSVAAPEARILSLPG